MQNLPAVCNLARYFSFRTAFFFARFSGLIAAFFFLWSKIINNKKKVLIRTYSSFFCTLLTGIIRRESARRGAVCSNSCTCVSIYFNELLSLPIVENKTRLTSSSGGRLASHRLAPSYGNIHIWIIQWEKIRWNPQPTWSAVKDKAITNEAKARNFTAPPAFRAI